MAVSLVRPAEPISAPLYESVADHVAGLISIGALRPGQRAPSVRTLSAQQRVSVATVVRAYEELEGRGLLRARPQSGFFVQRIAPPPPEPTVARAQSASTRVTSAALIARLHAALEDPGVVRLGAAAPSSEILPVERLNRTMAAIARTAGAQGIAYSPTPGPVALRRQLSRRAVDWGCALAPEDFVTTLGASEALSLALRAVTSPGDTVAVETPTYFGIWQLLASLELNVLEIPVHPSDGLDLEVLESVLDANEPAAVIATPNFNNPLGCIMSEERKSEMARILATRETPLIEDNIYGELQFDGPPPRPVHSFDHDGRVLLCGSLSKTLAPGYRIGWLAPGRYMAQVQALQRTHSIALPTLPQLAVADFLRTGGYDRHLRRLRRTLAVQVERMRAAVAEHFPADTRISRPQGGLVLWVELPTEIDTVELHEAAMARGISFAPGMLFSARSRFRRCLRLSCGMPWSPQLAQAVATLGRLAKSMKPREG